MRQNGRPFDQEHACGRWHRMINKPCRLRKKCSFSLIELIVVLVIVGAILGIAVPTLARLPLGIRLDAAITGINAAFYRAASMAASTNQPVKVVIDFSSSEIRLVRLTSPSSLSLASTVAFDDDDITDDFFSTTTPYILPAELTLDFDRLDLDLDIDVDAPKVDYLFFPNGEAAGPALPLRLQDRLSIDLAIDRLTGRPLMTTLDDR